MLNIYIYTGFNYSIITDSDTCGILIDFKSTSTWPIRLQNFVATMLTCICHGTQYRCAKCIFLARLVPDLAWPVCDLRCCKKYTYFIARRTRNAKVIGGIPELSELRQFPTFCSKLCTQQSQHTSPAHLQRVQLSWWRWSPSAASPQVVIISGPARAATSSAIFH